MPSNSYQEWATGRADELDEIERAHAAVGGTGRGRRYATQQVNNAYAVLLASQFQAFCRDLHSESVDRLILAITPLNVRPIVRNALTRDRQLDKGNAQPSSIGSDYGRLGLDFWQEVEGIDPFNHQRKGRIEILNGWRNAVAHQNFDKTKNKLGGIPALRLSHVREWRRDCTRLARSFDDVMAGYLRAQTGTAPW
jgi:hypothetical protein